MTSLGKRYAALFEVCLVSLLLTFVGWLRETYLAYLKCGMLWHFGFPAFMMLIALLAIVLPRRSFRIYGFLLRSSRLTSKWSSAFIAVFIIPTAVSMGCQRLWRG
ncbi:MAG: hypothetical protein QXD66_06555 [Candidatus Nezhaarchaeales archaeon]